MSRKNKKKLMVAMIVLLLFNVVTVIKFSQFNNNNHNETIVVEMSKKYMNGNDNIDVSKKTKNETEYVKLYKNNNTYNEKFNMTNMLPGDFETKNYCINVSYKDTITLKFSAKTQSEHSDLDEVLKIKIKLINTDEILYDDTIINIPKTIDYTASSNKSISDDFCYEITAYLDTNVGNEYQNKETNIDFKWTIDNKNLEKEPNPTTIDNIKFWIAIAIICSIALILILPKLKNERKRVK